jgi:hypothetical protein
MGLGGLSVNTPQLEDLGLNVSSWTIVLLENSNPWSVQEGKGLSPTSIQPKGGLEGSLTIVDLDSHIDGVGHYETTKQTSIVKHEGVVIKITKPQLGLVAMQDGLTPL